MSNPDLWRFALSVYKIDGVAPACLDLQETASVDVPLLLCAAFTCRQGLHFTPDHFNDLHNLTGRWQEEIVQNLRAIRQRLKSAPKPAPTTATEALRSQVKAAELAAEKIQLAVMQDWVDHLRANNLPVNNVPVGDQQPDLQQMSTVLGLVVSASKKAEPDEMQKVHIEIIANAAITTTL